MKYLRPDRFFHDNRLTDHSSWCNKQNFIIAREIWKKNYQIISADI